MEQAAYRNLELTDGWQFCLGDVQRWKRVDQGVSYNTTKAGHELGDLKVFLEENPWEPVAMPHDWCTELPADPEASPANGFKPRWIGWYHTVFELPDMADDTFVCLEFDGVMGESVVYVNGVIAVRSESGYTPFSADISDYVLPGENRIAVSVDTTRQEGWWYEGAGIYRPVRIRIRPAVHLAYGGIFAKPVREDGRWTLCVSAEVENTAETPEAFSLALCLKDAEGTPAAAWTAAGQTSPFGTESIETGCAVDAPQLWSPDTPYLYTLECTLRVGETVTDTQTLRVGFRDIEWTDHGMFINGVKTPLRGICCHQDHGGAGIAVGTSLTRWRVQRLREMGCNAYRWAHNCPSGELLDACDELGMLVMAENRHFRTSDEVMGQIDALVRLSRNHPSVFLYSLFNEEGWQREKRGRKMAAKLRRRIRMLDDTRPVTAAMSGGILEPDNASDALDVTGLNYFIDEIPVYAARHPGKPMAGTENGPIFATRGVYESDEASQVFDAYGLHHARFGQAADETVQAIRAVPQAAGQFFWGGFDYRGEPSPYEWPSVFCHWGFMDCCGFEKDIFYMLKSYYSDETAPMVHLMPHWNWQEGKTVRVCAMTNCQAVRLFLNGRPLGCKTVEANRAEWAVPFEPGVLRAEAELHGVTVCDEVRTAGAPARLEVIDAAPPEAYDCTILNVRLLDADDIPVPDIGAEVSFEVLRGKLIGTGNGDPNGVRPDRAASLPLFSGRCQALIRPDAGAAEVLVRCAGLPPVRYVRGQD